MNNGNSQIKKKPQQIFDTSNTDNVGITLWTEDTLQAITKQSGIHAKGNEYQVHYWALNVRITADDGSRLDISIPTVLFNYKQQVSAAHIDFELSDVDNISNQLEVIHNIEVNKLLAQVQAQFGDAGNVATVEYISTNLNSLHRHPGGRRQGFSGTDYGKSAEVETGIVFPLSEGVNKSNFASIICEQEGKTYLAHTEYRVANGKIDGTKGKVTYTKGRCASYVSAPIHAVSKIESLFGYKDVEQAYKVTDHLDIQNSTLFDSIVTWWDSLDYKADIQFIVPENVTKKVYAKTPNKFTSKPVNGNLKQRVMSYEVEDEEVSLSPQMLIEVIEFAAKQHELTIPSFDLLENLNQTELNSLFNTLEIHYYAIDEELLENEEDPEMLEYYGLTMEDSSLEDLIELYDLVLVEIAEELLETKDSETEEITELDRMRNALLDMGADPSHIQYAPAYLIEQWYNNIMGE